MLRLLISFLLLALGAHTLFSVTNSAQSLSSYLTLVDGVTYDLNFTIPSQSIAAGSKVKLQFSSRYTISDSTFINCKASTSSATAPTTATSSVTANAGGSNIYEVLISGMYSSTATHSFLRLKFDMSNPYAASSETVNITIQDSSTAMVGFGAIYFTYTASSMTGCAVTSSSQYTSDNATHTFTMTSPYRLIANSYLMINMAAWNTNTSTNSQGSTTLTCTGVTVNSL